MNESCVAVSKCIYTSELTIILSNSTYKLLATLSYFLMSHMSCILISWHKSILIQNSSTQNQSDWNLKCMAGWEYDQQFVWIMLINGIANTYQCFMLWWMMHVYSRWWHESMVAANTIENWNLKNNGKTCNSRCTYSVQYLATHPFEQE